MGMWISIKKWSIIGAEYGLKEFNLLLWGLLAGEVEQESE
jgi:hypothetical protein